MSITIERSIDIEEEIRDYLSDYFTVYVRPLPKEYTLPNLLITQVGGSESDKIDTFSVVLDARAETDADALDLINDAIGALKLSEIGWITTTSLSSWGSDPVRPDLRLCTARLSIVTHKTTKTI